MAETPAPDQLSAMGLIVASGDEDEILRRANVIRASEAGLAHDAFRSVRAVRPTAAPVPPPPAPYVEELDGMKTEALRKVGERQRCAGLERDTRADPGFGAGGVELMPDACPDG